MKAIRDSGGSANDTFGYERVNMRVCRLTVNQLQLRTILRCAQDRLRHEGRKGTESALRSLAVAGSDIL